MPLNDVYKLQTSVEDARGYMGKWRGSRDIRNVNFLDCTKICLETIFAFTFDMTIR